MVNNIGFNLELRQHCSFHGSHCFTIYMISLMCVCDFRDLISQLPLDLRDVNTNCVHIQQVLSGYLQLNEVDLLLPCLKGKAKNETAVQLLDNVFMVRTEQILSGFHLHGKD